MDDEPSKKFVPLAAAWLGKPTDSLEQGSTLPSADDSSPQFVPLAAAWLGKQAGESTDTAPQVENAPHIGTAPPLPKPSFARPSQVARALEWMILLIGLLLLFWSTAWVYGKLQLVFNGNAPVALSLPRLPTAGLIYQSPAAVNQQLLWIRPVVPPAWAISTPLLMFICDENQGLPADLHHSPVNGAAPQAIAALLGLGVQKIMIDPGHGGRDWGAKGASGLLEKDLVLDISKQLRDELQQLRPDLQIYLTRDSDIFLSLRERVDKANAAQVDLFISIHINALLNDFAPFTETYFPSVQGTDVRADLLQIENAESGYTLHEFRQLTARLENTLKQQESERLATAIQQQLFPHLHAINPDLVNAGVKSAPFVVLMGTQMPSVLVEVTSLSNPVEETRLADATYRREIARGLARGIQDYLRR